MKKLIQILTIISITLILSGCEDSLGIEDNVDVTHIGKKINESTSIYDEYTLSPPPLQPDSVKFNVEEKVSYFYQDREHIVQLIWWDFLKDNNAWLQENGQFDKLTFDFTIYKSNLDSVGLFFPVELLQISFDIDSVNIFPGQIVNLLDGQTKYGQWLFTKTISLFNEKYDYYGNQTDALFSINKVIDDGKTKEIQGEITAKVPTQYRIGYGPPPPIELTIRFYLFFS